MWEAGTEISDHPVLLFDGVCNLCNGAVQWVLRHDKEARLRFASLQSDAGRVLLARHGQPLAAMDTVVLVDGDRVWLKSDALFEVLRLAGGAWSILRPLRFLPRVLRDAVYDWVARNRYRWFGRREECWVPTADLGRRFLE